MSCDLKTDSVPDPPREVIDDQEEASSLPMGISPEEKEDNRENVNKNYLHPPKQPTFSKKKKASPKSTQKSNKNKEDERKKKNRSPESTIIKQEFHIQHSNGVHIGPNYTVTIDKSATTKSQNPPKETKTIRGLMESKTPCRQEHIRAIQLHIGENWKDVGRKLGFSDANLFQVKADHDREGMKEVVYQMLLQWIQKNGCEATLGELTKALWDCLEYSAVKELAAWTKES